MFRSLHKNIKIRIITSFFSMLVGSMIYPFMAIYFSEGFGAGIAGILLVVNIFISMLVGMYGGYLADKIGRKKIMVLGSALTAISYLFMALVNSPLIESVWITYGFFVLNGIAGGLSGPAINALLIDSSTEENRAFMFSIQYWSHNVAFMLGSLAGGFLFEYHRSWLFFSMGIVTLVILIVTILFLTDEYVPKKIIQKVHIVKDIALSYRVVITDKIFVIFVLAETLLWSLEEHGARFVAVRIAEEFKTVNLSLFDWTTIRITGYKLVGYLNTQNALMVVCFAILVTKLIKGKNIRQILYLCVFSYTIGYVFLGFSNTLAALIIAGLINSIGEMTAVPIAQKYTAEMMDQNARGAYSAFLNSCGQLQHFAGAIGLSLYTLIGKYGMSAFLFLTGMGALLLFRVSIRMHEGRLVQKDRMASE